jgi:integrase
LAYAGLASLVLYASFVFVQTVRYRDYFLPLGQGLVQHVYHASTVTSMQLSWSRWTCRADTAIADRGTAHGFRSSFRDWGTEVAKVREVVAEAALAHGVRDKTEAAYRRAPYLDERRKLMERWAAFCTSAKSSVFRTHIDELITSPT